MFETPIYSRHYQNDILNTHIAYGIAECLIREGLENICIYPAGSKYYVSPENEYALIVGLKSALNDMLALHYAISECRLIKVGGRQKQVTISNVSFCNGAFLDPPQNTQAYPQILQKILDFTEIDPKKLKKRKIKINKKELKPPLSLDPTLGSYICFYSIEDCKGISALDYALAWIGLHYYSVFINTNNYLYILCFKPLSKLSYIDILSLKDFATKTKMTVTNIDGSLGYKYIVLRFFAELNSLYPMIFEENGIIPKSFRIIVYGIEKTKTKGYRFYDYVDITKIWKFMTLLKIEDLKNYRFLLKILSSQKNSESKDLRIISELLYNMIVYENIDSAYNFVRYLKMALKERIPQSFIESIIEFLELYKGAKNDC